MMVKIIAVCVFFFIGKTYGGLIPDPIGIIDSAAGTVSKGAKSVAGGIVEGSKTVAKTVGEVSDQVVNTTNSVAGKVHEGIFDVENGFVNGVDEVIGTPVDINEVNFYLATSQNLDNPKKIDFYKPKEVVPRNGKIYFLIHGWTGNRNTSWYRDFTEILTNKNGENHVIQVDWSKPAGDLYPLAAFQTESVGNFVGILVNRLVNDYKVPRDDIVIIGHSLGGQISGWAGKKFKELKGKKLKRIIALDPAGPLFIHRPDSRRLNKDDAEVVMVIHSDGGKLGFPSACGTIDFFPNGGSNQPGCWKVNLSKVSTYVDPVTCDHSRSWDFFIEALNSTESFLARKCESYDKFQENVCEAAVVSMGDLETTAEGSYYLDTNEEKPYSKELKKIEGKLEKVEKKVNKDEKKSEEVTEKSVKNSFDEPVTRLLF